MNELKPEFFLTQVLKNNQTKLNCVAVNTSFQSEASANEGKIYIWK